MPARPGEGAEDPPAAGRAAGFPAFLAGWSAAFGALIGDWLIGLPYDPHYAAARPMMVVLALSWTARDVFGGGV